MITRVFRATPKRGGTADELACMAREITIPLVEAQPGLVARYTGRGVGETGEEFGFSRLSSGHRRVASARRRGGGGRENERLAAERARRRTGATGTVRAPRRAAA